MRKFTRKMALAFGALLITTGFNTTKAQAGAALNLSSSFPADNVFLPQAISTNSLVGNSKITVEAWVRPTTLAGLGVIIGNYTTPSNQLQFLLRRDNTGFSFYVGQGNTTSYSGYVTAVNTATINIWQHIAGVFDGTVISVYINGAFSGSVNASANYTFAATTNSIILGTNSISESFDGDIDEVRIWNTNRSKCEINTYKDCEIPTNASNLVANYHFNQGIASANNAAVTTLNDATSNAFNGTLNNLALNGATGNWITPGGVVSGFTTALAPPAITINPSANITTCLNNTVVLTALGANTYTWSGGVVNAVAFTATASNVYTVTATAATGCTNTAVASITTNICPGAALNFDGVNDVVNCGTAISSSLANSPVITLEAWVNPAEIVSTAAIVNNHVAGTQFCLRKDADHYNFFIGFGTYSALTPVGTATVNTWQHIAAVFNQTVLSVYINGVLSTTSVIPSYVLTATSPMVRIGNDGFGEPFNGNIDEVRIWKSARTLCEINTYKDCEIPADATNLLANYHFNQGVAFSPNATVTVLNDATSNANNGTLSSMALSGITSNWVSPGGVVSGFTTTLAPPSLTVNANPSLAACANNTLILTASGASTYSWTGSITNGVAFIPATSNSYTVSATAATGCTATAVADVTVNACPGEVLNFDGVNDVVNCGTAISSSLANSPVITLEAWVNPAEIVSTAAIVNNHVAGTQFCLRKDADHYNFFIGFGTYSALTPVGTATVNTWQHIAAVFNQTVLSVYINGVLSTTSVIPSYVLTATSPMVRIGNDGFGEPFNGNIDEVRIWKSARTLCEINTYKDCEIPADATNLLANYHFNQGVAFSPNATVTILNDATSNANNGTLSSMALSGITSNWVSPSSVSAGYTTAVAAPGYTNTALAICPTGTVILGGTNGTSYSWTPTITNNAPFTPTASTTYSFAGTNSVTSCSVTAALNVTVNPSPTVTAVTSETNVICVGQSATLTATGASSFVWNTTAVTAVIAISPTVTTTYTVTGTDVNGCSDMATVTQSVSACTGIVTNGSSISLEIYPNPSSGLFNIKANSQVTIEVFDVLGNLVLRADINSGDYKLNLGEQNRGLYLVKCISQGQIKSYRLIKD